MSFEVGDKVVYAPHGAGTVISKERREGAHAGEYLSIRIAHSKMTLMVPADAARDKGVRPVVDATSADALLAALETEPQPLPENPQQRARKATDIQRIGDAQEMADMLRDYHGLQEAGKRLSAGEQRVYVAATTMLASEIALATDTEFQAAVERVERALGIPAEQ